MSNSLGQLGPDVLRLLYDLADHAGDQVPVEIPALLHLDVTVDFPSPGESRPNSYPTDGKYKLFVQASYRILAQAAQLAVTVAGFRGRARGN